MLHFCVSKEAAFNCKTGVVKKPHNVQVLLRIRETKFHSKGTRKESDWHSRRLTSQKGIETTTANFIFIW